MAASPKPSSGIKSAKAVSEATRERETFRYDPSLLADSRFARDGNLFPSSELATAGDSILTALAQLGAYQTRTDRGFISLFDSTRQYVIAEATPDGPIAPGHPSDSCPSPLSLCGTAIPRSQGTCDHVLYLTNDLESLDPEELPLSFVPDLTQDARFASRPYCQFGAGGQFYAGVPIRTKRGINIGAYCVMSQKPPEGWDDKYARCLRDISRAIMDHLEFNRSKHAYRRHELINRGLGSFIEGRDTVADWGSNPEADIDDVKAHEGFVAARQKLEKLVSKSQAREEAALTENELKVTTGDIAAAHGGAFVNSPTDTSDTEKPDHPRKTNTFLPDDSNPADSNPAEAANSDENRLGDVFSRAANIIREAFDVEACIFFDVAIGSYKPPPVHGRIGETDADDNTGQASSNSSSDEQGLASRGEAPETLCDLLGFSTSKASSISHGKLINNADGAVPKQLLAKLLKRYPKGRIFSFDAIGELQSSDFSEEDTSFEARDSDDADLPDNHDHRDQTSEAAKKRQGSRRYSRINEGALIHQSFPSALSVAFIPVWDLKYERWLAGGFIYTTTPTRSFSIEGELSFLTAFSGLMSTEIQNLATLKADKVKSDALGSLSHELRSPLHGIILGTELLNDTDLSAFQGNIMHTIETCSRTMLDTIDHLLDYSKVNSFAAKRKQGAHIRAPKLRRTARSDYIEKKLYLDVRLDGLVEDVTESIFAGFSFQRMSIRQFSKKSKKKHNDYAAHNRLDSMQATEQLGSPLEGSQKEYGIQFDNVSVYISIDPTFNWMFFMQPGAIRRIVMNLFGNSLKYTTKGTIRVSLTQETRAPNPKRSDSEIFVKLTVEDTGKGMSEEFMRHRIFKPFSQEDELSSGTGLGLSLVKKIVSQLHGHISVESQAGVGTTFAVIIPMEQSSSQPNKPIELAEDDKEFEERVRELKGLRVSLSGFESLDNREGHLLVEDICRRWLYLDVVGDDEKKADVVLRPEDSLPESLDNLTELARTPNVVVCQDALSAYQRFTMYENIGQGSVFDFVSQPIGPRNLAKSILLAYKRWMGLAKTPPHSRPPAPSRTGSSYSRNLPTLRTTVLRSPATEKAIEILASEIPPTKTDSVDAFATQMKSSENLVIEEDVLAETVERLGVSKVLLVDDNHINLKILSVFMRKLGRPYEAVTNGKEAVDAYTQQRGDFTVILMDISMPIMDGLEATRRIRAFEHQNQLPSVAILALTGLALDSTRQEAIESGVDVFLTKPVKLKALSELLESMNILPTEAWSERKQ